MTSPADRTGPPIRTEGSRRVYGGRPSGCQASASFVLVEPVPQPTDVPEIARIRRHGFDLPAQRHDVVVHGAVVDVHTLAPHGIEQLFAGEHPALPADKRDQELEFDRA